MKHRQSLGVYGVRPVQRTFARSRSRRRRCSESACGCSSGRLASKHWKDGDSAMNVAEALLTRRTVRAFRPDPVSLGTVTRILSAHPPGPVPGPGRSTSRQERLSNDCARLPLSERTGTSPGSRILPSQRDGRKPAGRGKEAAGRLGQANRYGGRLTAPSIATSCARNVSACETRAHSASRTGVGH